jgi:hypothetical protein
MDVEVHGADAFLALSKHLKAIGETELRKELHRGLRQAAKPIIQAQKEAAARDLPQRGGLAKRVARSRITASVKTGRDPGVSIKTRRTSTDTGRLRHPVFGNRERWVTQTVDKGWFSETPYEAGRVADVRREIERVLVDVAQEVARRHG